MPNKVLIIIGTRPEAIKLLPIYNELKNKESFDPIIISTGQHKEMLTQVFDIFNVSPDIELGIMSKNQTLSGLTALLFTKLEEVYKIEKPDLVIVQGDTQSALVGSMVAYYNRIKVAHIEAGLRTFNKFSPFPEEVNRQCIGVVADYHFAPTDVAKNNLEKEGKSNVYTVGNTVVDALFWCKDIISNSKNSFSTAYKDILKANKMVLVTGHRRENFDSGLDAIADAILFLASKYPTINFVYPVHLNPNVRVIINDKLSNKKNIFLIEPVGYDEMVFLLSNSFCVITDSGGIQEEAPSFDVPVLVTRDTTERPEGISAGCAVLVGTDSENIQHAFVEIVENIDVYDKMSKSVSPYGDGTTSVRIVQILENELK